LEPPDFPVPIGIFHRVEEATYDEMMEAQIQAAKKPGADDLEKLILGPESWVVK